MRTLLARCRRISEHEDFDSAVLFFIMLSAALLGLETVPELNAQWDSWFYWLNLAVQCFFVAEIGIRILACGPRFRTFFFSRGNSFDFALVALSLVPAIGGVALAARLVRLLRVLTVSERLRGFLDRVSVAFDEALFGGLIAAVLGYVFTIGGYYLFGQIDPGRWGSFSAAARTVFYLLLAQDVPGSVGPLLVTSKANILYFLVFYFVYVALFIGVLAAAVADAVRRQRG